MARTSAITENTNNNANNSLDKQSLQQNDSNRQTSEKLFEATDFQSTDQAQSGQQNYLENQQKQNLDPDINKNFGNLKIEDSTGNTGDFTNSTKPEQNESNKKEGDTKSEENKAENNIGENAVENDDNETLKGGDSKEGENKSGVNDKGDQEKGQESKGTQNDGDKTDKELEKENSADSSEDKVIGNIEDGKPGGGSAKGKTGQRAANNAKANLAKTANGEAGDAIKGETTSEKAEPSELNLGDQSKEAGDKTSEKRTDGADVANDKPEVIQGEGNKKSDENPKNENEAKKLKMIPAVDGNSTEEFKFKPADGEMPKDLDDPYQDYSNASKIAARVA